MLQIILAALLTETIDKMKLLKVHYVFFILLFVLSSCVFDCIQNAEGVILDKNTKLPIDNVIISDENIQANSYVQNFKRSNKLGVFKFHRMAGGYKCPDLALYFYKKGYTLHKIILEPVTKNDTIYLEQEK